MHIFCGELCHPWQWKSTNNLASWAHVCWLYRLKKLIFIYHTYSLIDPIPCDILWETLVLLVFTLSISTGLLFFWSILWTTAPNRTKHTIISKSINTKSNRYETYIKAGYQVFIAFPLICIGWLYLSGCCLFMGYLQLSDYDIMLVFRGMLVISPCIPMLVVLWFCYTKVKCTWLILDPLCTRYYHPFAILNMRTHVCFCVCVEKVWRIFNVTFIMKVWGV